MKCVQLFGTFIVLAIFGLLAQGCSETRDRRVDNLRAFARLYGYVKYFHPSDESAALEWDKFLVYGAERVIETTSSENLRDRLKELFLPIAPTIQITVGELPPAVHASLEKDAYEGAHVVAWQHASSYASARIGRDSTLYRWVPFSKEYPNVGEVYEADLGVHLRARIPLALWADSVTTFPRGQLDSLNEKIERALGDNEEEGLSAGLAPVIKFWNMHEHFFPYFGVVDVDWNSELDAALKRALRAATTADRVDNLKLMIASLKDGHGRVDYKGQRDTLWIPVRFGWIEDQLAVTFTDTFAVAVGDVVDALDGVATNDWFEQVEKRISGSPQRKRIKAASSLSNRQLISSHVASGVADSVSLLLRRSDSSRYEVVLKRHVRWSERPLGRSGKSIRTLDGGVYYIDLTRATWEMIGAQINEIASAVGVVFDLRGYPNESAVEILQHLIEEPDSTKWMFIPLVTRPHMEGVSWIPIGWDLQPADPHIQGEVIFLTDARAISYAESIMGYVHGYKLGDIVGTETAGANGNVTFLNIGDWNVRSTGMKVLRQDGKQLFGVGIPPDIRSEPTLEGLRAGRDDVLEAGLSVLRAKIEADRLE